MDGKNKEISEALWKKALGYQSTETADEYGLEDGQLVLKKQLVKTKEVPADMNALKLVLKEAAGQYESMTDEELEAERLRLMKMLQ